jgi:hypothetical protein
MTRERKEDEDLTEEELDKIDPLITMGERKRTEEERKRTEEERKKFDRDGFGRVKNLETKFTVMGMLIAISGTLETAYGIFVFPLICIAGILSLVLGLYLAFY